MKKYLILALFAGGVVVASEMPVFAQKNDKIGPRPPYTIQKCLTRAEELFKANNYREAAIFYYEALALAKNDEVLARLHFRIGECLEGMHRFDFATYHYQKAATGKLPDLLASRAVMKLEHLPEMAQTEEATRLFKRAMDLYRKRNIRDAIDDYLASLRLMPTLMAQDESGLIEDAVKYLTFLSETKDREPDRLLKLATFLELRGETEKAIETLQQIVIIYPESDQARQADEKLENFSHRKTSYIESVHPENAVKQAFGEEQKLIFNDVFEFKNAGIISRQLDGAAFTLKAINEQRGIPADRFEIFTVIFGNESEQREFMFTAEEGVDRQSLSFETGNVKYFLNFTSVIQTKGYIQDLYGDGKKSVTLFSNVGVQIKIERGTN